MSRAVNKTEFWKERIEEAGQDLRLSVYRTPLDDWEYLCNIHKKICDELINPEDSVLDVACGYGRASEWFGGKYVGIDFSEDFIKKAKEFYPERTFYVQDAEKTFFDDKQFDWVVCVSFKQMIERELGSLEWAKIEMELKRIAKNILLLEYSSPGKFEVINS